MADKKKSWLSEAIEGITSLVSRGCDRELLEELLAEKFKESYRNGAYAERRKHQKPEAETSH